MKTQKNYFESRIMHLDDENVSYGVEPAIDINSRLTEHFTLREFVRSKTALDNGIDNMPGRDEVERLRLLCVNVLEPLRKRFGIIRITSGYRCYRLNEKVNGARNSQHLYGEAADIHIGSNELGMKFYEYVMQNLEFDQMLLEVKGKGNRKVVHCLHISYKSDRGKNRKMCKMYYLVGA